MRFSNDGVHIMPRFFTHQKGWTILNISVGIYMATLDASVMNISLPTIIRSLDSNLKMAAWVMMAYLIVITGSLLLMGRLSDLFGQRRMYLWGLFIFTVGSILCGFSPAIHALIASRMVQGLGASALMAIGPAIITRVYPEKDRGQVLGILGSIVSVGYITGPLVGGFLIEHLGWRAIFFVNLPIGIVGIYLSSIVLQKGEPADKSPVDIKGAMLLFIFLSTFLLLLSRIGEGIRHWTWGYLFISICSLGLFIMVEHRSPFPLVNLRFFRGRLFTSSLLASLFSFWMQGAHGFVIPFFLQNLLEFSPSKVGMLIFPVALTVMVIAPLGGRLSDRIGVRIPATLGLTLTSLTIFSFIFLREGIGNYDILWRQVLLGIGIGLFNPANNSAILGSLPKEQSGLASSFLALARNLGLAIGVGCAEMVIALGSATGEREIVSLKSIQDVWRLSILIGLMALLVSWAREKKSV
jgi:EmrB/QacA subfamily drug resistance transporter